MKRIRFAVDRSRLCLSHRDEDQSQRYPGNPRHCGPSHPVSLFLKIFLDGLLDERQSRLSASSSRNQANPGSLLGLSDASISSTPSTCKRGRFSVMLRIPTSLSGVRASKFDSAEKPFCQRNPKKSAPFIWPTLNDQSSGSGFSAATLAGFFAKTGVFQQNRIFKGVLPKSSLEAPD